jgi:hypothetical protein
MMFEFKHPKYYKELRMQYGPHKAISDSAENSKAASVRPGSRPKRQASSAKQQATSESKPEPSSGSEASSSKHQASSYKRQA